MEQELKLSDAFFEKRDKLFVEIIVKVINVNYEKGARLLEKCRLLREYSILIHKIRLHCEKGMELKDAISISVRECIKEGILAVFLKRNGGEIMSFLYQALSREECEAIREQDGYIRGKEDQQRFSAKKLKAMNMPAAEIAEVTGLPIDEIEAL